MKFETQDKEWVRVRDVQPGELMATQTDLMRWTRRRRNGSPRVLVRTEDPYKSKLWRPPGAPNIVGDRPVPTSPSQKALRVRVKREESRIIIP